MTTLKQQLIDLAAHKHSDLSIGNDAVDYIEELEANLTEAAKGLDYYEEVLLLRKKVEKYETILKHAMAERSGAFFICGEAGEKDSMGLPEKIIVCPAYGLDGFASYKKDRDYSAPGW